MVSPIFTRFIPISKFSNFQPFNGFKLNHLTDKKERWMLNKSLYLIDKKRLVLELKPSSSLSLRFKPSDQIQN